MIRRILSQQKNLDSRYMFTWENYKLDKMQRFNACSSLGICGDWTRIFLFSSYYPCPCPWPCPCPCPWPWPCSCPCPCRGFYAFSPDFCDLISSLESCGSERIPWERSQVWCCSLCLYKCMISGLREFMSRSSCLFLELTYIISVKWCLTSNSLSPRPFYTTCI